MKEKNKNIMYIFFIFWIYLNFVSGIVAIFIKPAIINYILLTLLMFATLVLRKFKIAKKLLIFFVSYILIVIINALIVSYSKYVYIEGFSSFLIFMLPLYLLSDEEFELKELLERWNKFAIISFPIAIVLIVLYKMQVIPYNVFDDLLLPNVIILLYFYPRQSAYKKRNLFLIVFYIGILVLFASRMAAIACILAVVFNLIWNNRKDTKKLAITCICTVALGILLILNLEFIINSIISILEIFNFKSRTLALLGEQLQNGSLFENIYLSNREVIYSLAKDFIFNRAGMPGGFAVILNLTQGKYYHAHNLFLQLGCFFGIIGTIAIIVMLIYKFKELKRNASEETYEFCFMLFVFYLIYSVANANFLNSFISITCMGILFLKNSSTNKFIGGPNEDK